MVSTDKNCVELEIDSRNSDVIFQPLGRRVRTKFDFSKIGDKHAAERHRAWGGSPIPGQVLGLDMERKVGYVKEPLHDHPDLKKKVEEKNLRLAPPVEEFENIDWAMWCFWMRRLVEGGHATVILGEIPTEGVPKRLPGRKPTGTELLAAIEWAKATPEEKKLAEEKLGELLNY